MNEQGVLNTGHHRPETNGDRSPTSSPKRKPLSFPTTRATFEMQADTSMPEKNIFWSSVTCIAILIGLLFLSYFMDHLLQTDVSWLLPALISSLLIMFGAPGSRFARPRAMIGGYWMSLAVALCVSTFPLPPPLIWGAAIAAALLCAVIFDVLHPPAVGFAFTMSQQFPLSNLVLASSAALIAIGCTAIILLRPPTQVPAKIEMC